MLKMLIRDKIITAACLTRGGIEWTTRKKKPEGTETVEQGNLPFATVEEGVGTAMVSVLLPDGIANKLKGDLTASIRTSELLMRTMEFPTADPAEIASMVGFQIDKISPFPLDEIAVSHEVLRTTENGALVLMVAAKRDCIDSIGDTFGEKNIHIHSIDARVLGWLNLIKSGKHISEAGCEILIIDDGIDYALTILLDGVPYAFRSLCASIADEEKADELAYEIGYTLTALDAERVLTAPGAVDYWSIDEPSTRMMDALRRKTGLPIRRNDLSTLPPLSEGIIERAAHSENRIELIPHEWIEHMQNKRLRKNFMIISSAIVATWILCLLVFFTIYQIRSTKLNGIKKEADAITPVAAKALENRRKLNALKLYADRSDSALECLRETTRLLPEGDIEFVSYNYSKEKGVTLRGTAGSDDVAYDYFAALNKSKLFERLKDQSVNRRITKGVQRAVYSVTLVLPSQEEEQ